MPKKILIASFLLILIGGAIVSVVLLTRGDSRIEALPATSADCLNKDIPPPLSLTNTSSNQFLSLKDFSLELTQSVFKDCPQGVEEIVLVPEGINNEILLRSAELASSTSSPLLIYSSNSIPMTEVKRLNPKQIIFVGSQTLQDEYIPQLVELLDSNISPLKILSYKTTDLRKMTQEVEKRFAAYDISNIFDNSLNVNQQIVHLNQANIMYRSIQNNGPEILNTPLDSEGIDDTKFEPQNDSPTWIFKPVDNKYAAVALSAINVDAGYLFFTNPSEDLRRSNHIGNFINPTTPVTLIGSWTEENLWQLEVLKRSTSLPSGKYVLFENERMIGFYGLLNLPQLGVLGTYSTPTDALNGLAGYLNVYQTPDTILTPAFEIITTIADKQAGKNGDYSRRVPIDEILPWVLEAERLGVYVVLDLQPGRTDFLTQAKEYEELLKFEHVGLALDPEWRLAPDEFHLDQIGSVAAEEVNQVVDWLQNLVQENYLPQKLLMLHQFHISMIRNRADVKSVPELAVMVHMDGQGTLDLKYGSYDILARRFVNEPPRFFGWKNFFFVDSPTPSPEIVLALNPLPSYISYQ